MKNNKAGPDLVYGSLLSPNCPALLMKIFIAISKLNKNFVIAKFRIVFSDQKQALPDRGAVPHNRLLRLEIPTFRNCLKCYIIT